MTDDMPETIRLGASGANDELVAEEVFDRFVDRLIALARSRLSPKLARRIDPEDIVQSACRSFFRSARAGRYELRQSNDLWKLLAAITVNKVRHQVERNTAARRTVSAEESRAGADASWGIDPQAIDREPLPEEAAALAEETAEVMSGLSPLHRTILQRRLQGNSAEETAREAKCAERTVHRAMELVRKRLEQRLLPSEGSLGDQPLGFPRKSSQNGQSRCHRAVAESY